MVLAVANLFGSKFRTKESFYKNLKIRFTKGGTLEPGMDDGGLTKEMFILFFKHALCHLKVFTESHREVGAAVLCCLDDNNTDTTALESDEAVVGKVMVKAIVEGAPHAPLPSEWFQGFVMDFILHNREPTHSTLVSIGAVREDQATKAQLEAVQDELRSLQQ